MSEKEKKKEKKSFCNIVYNVLLLVDDLFQLMIR